MKIAENFSSYSLCTQSLNMDKSSDSVCQVSQVYWDNLNKMTPTQKIQAFLDLYWTARELKAAGLRLQFPSDCEEEIQKKVREIFLYAVD